MATGLFEFCAHHLVDSEACNDILGQEVEHGGVDQDESRPCQCSCLQSRFPASAILLS